MTIAAITKKYNEQQLAAFFPGADIQWVLLREVQAVPDVEVYFDLDFTPGNHRCEALSRLQPVLIVVNAVVPTIKQLGYPFVRINGWPGFLERSVHELVAPDEATAQHIVALYTRLGHDYRLVADTPGMITARILSAVINEAWYTWEAEVSTKEEIDTAMRLGTNYPLGPFEWGERIGLGQITGLLRSLSQTNSAYIPAAALEQAAEGLKCD
ncbi:3-hydroxyacyl-CoA dehydrogenase family protein [Puia dinghuensis]|uniref:3-hydroxyacyl-CoA dehydrogenase C-terminal domain-containing protein n=1 Tax=Puia dinghuensis TaxID=1792502 RepID=A0A8J2UF63_9BACT|nr:3-hydroxyacyl-CoA dehydrogenase family protein [Puia dinghuensis]GGB09110.1 hypothetical protein GCM10011511_35830 [Puia dinghuensis]